MHYTIREATHHDAIRFVDLISLLVSESTEIIRETDEHYLVRTHCSNDPSPTRNSTQRTLLLALNTNRALGFVGAMGNCSLNKPNVAKLFMGVRMDHWGFGIGSALLNNVIHSSYEKGISRLELSVDTLNNRAISFYKKSGFEIEGAARRALSVGGELTSHYLMGKSLS